MQITYELIPDDLRELKRVARQNQPGAKSAYEKNPAKRPSYLFYGLLAVLLAIMFFSLSAAQHTAQPPVNSPTPLTLKSIVLTAIPWTMLAVFLFVILRSLFFPSDAALRKKLRDTKLQCFDIDASGVRGSSGAIETIWRWEAFDKFVETEKGFFLRITNSISFVLIPKRAIATEAAATELRELFRSSIHGSTGGFPVIPISAV